MMPSSNASPGQNGLESAIRAFEDAWQRGETPCIDNFLPADGPQRVPTLIELVHADLEIRLKRGEPVRVESYLQRYPELTDQSTNLLSLARAEFTVRRRQEPGLDAGE